MFILLMVSSANGTINYTYEPCNTLKYFVSYIIMYYALRCHDS